MAENFSRIPDIIEESEATRGGSDEMLLQAVPTRPNRTKSQMLSVRLPIQTVHDIESVAAKADVPVSALIRGWILDGLAAHSDSVPRTLDRLEAELGRLRGLVQ